MSLVNSAVCQYPLLRKSLQFPPSGVSQSMAKTEVAKAPRIRLAGIGEMIGSFLLKAIFNLMSFLVKPFEKVIGETYSGGEVRFEDL
jgi:hypothetical protein